MGMFPLEAGRGEIPRGLSQLWDPFLVLLVRAGWNSGFACMEKVNTEINQAVRERFPKHSTISTKTIWGLALLISFCSNQVIFKEFRYFPPFQGHVEPRSSSDSGDESTAPFPALREEEECWRCPKKWQILQAREAGMAFPWHSGLGIVPFTFPEWDELAVVPGKVRGIFQLLTWSTCIYSLVSYGEQLSFPSARPWIILRKLFALGNHKVGRSGI